VTSSWLNVVVDHMKSSMKLILDCPLSSGMTTELYCGVQLMLKYILLISCKGIQRKKRYFGRGQTGSMTIEINSFETTII